VHVLDLAGAREADDRDGHDDPRLEPAVAARGRVSESIIDDTARRAYLRRHHVVRQRVLAPRQADEALQPIQSAASRRLRLVWHLQNPFRQSLREELRLPHSSMDAYG